MNSRQSQSTSPETWRRENQLPKVVFRPPDVCHGINATPFIPNPKTEKKRSLTGLKKRGKISTLVGSLEMMLRTPRRRC